MAICAFPGRKAFVTGGASGIGLGIAKALARRGAFVVIADGCSDKIDAALRETRAEGLAANVAALTLDVTDRTAFGLVAEQLLAELGGIDLLVNGAGADPRSHYPSPQAGHPDRDFGLGVNVGGVINGLHSFLPQMIAHGRGGHVVNTSSLAASLTMPADFAVYAADRAAVLNMSENLRDELASQGIGISVLCAACSLTAPMDFEAIGERVTEGILANELYIITDSALRAQMRARAAALLAAAAPEPALQA